ncbi:MAG TPA: CU044_2847 family protein [Conexibacter sp.]|nr:CU044_2847 family protein [Conexibacter sp.]
MSVSEPHQIVMFPLGESGTLAVELPPDELGGASPAAGEHQVKESFEQAVGRLRAIADGVMSAVSRVQIVPSEVTVEFSVRLDKRTGLVLVSAGAEASLKVRLTWQPRGG